MPTRRGVFLKVRDKNVISAWSPNIVNSVPEMAPRPPAGDIHLDRPGSDVRMS